MTIFIAIVVVVVVVVIVVVVVVVVVIVIGGCLRHIIVPMKECTICLFCKKTPL